MQASSQSDPLVSIIVITYNSSRYVLETLDSARDQTYQNVELIITDDASTDNTVQICQDWLEENKARFVRSKLITTEVNTGVSANCNRGLKEAQGEWVKYIAGDDVLLENCIEDNVGFVLSDPTIGFVFSDMKLMDENSHYLQNRLHDGTKTNVSAKNQLKILLKYSFVSAPSCFIKSKILKEVNGFDERFTLIEDLPLYIKFTKKNEKLTHLQKITVCYRIHPFSLWTSHLNSFGTNKIFLQDLIKLHEKVLLRETLQQHMPLLYLSKKINHIILKKKMEYPETYGLYKYLRVFDLLFMYNYIKKKVTQ